MNNKYVKRSRISESKFRQLLKHFALDLDAQQISVLCKLNRNTVNRYLYLIRIRIAEFCEYESPFQGEVEVDESYFGGHRIKGKRGRGAAGKKVVFGILVDLGYKKHYRVHHGKDEFANNKTHINGIESFWSFAKRRLTRFYGVPRSTFYLHLKECEFRFNYCNDNIYTMILGIIKNKPLC